MRVLWRLLLSGRVKPSWNKYDLYSWKQRLKRDGFNVTLRMELRDLLAPKVKLHEPFRLLNNENVNDPEHIWQ
jgi:hypothetical protein